MCRLSIFFLSPLSISGIKPFFLLHFCYFCFPFFNHFFLFVCNMQDHVLLLTTRCVSRSFSCRVLFLHSSVMWLAFFQPSIQLPVSSYPAAFLVNYHSLPHMIPRTLLNGYAHFNHALWCNNVSHSQPTCHSLVHNASYSLLE